VLNDIIQYGHVVRGWLGMTASPINPALARQLNLTTTSGLLVSGVYNTGPSHKAKILPGDIVTKIDGISVTDRQSTASQIADVTPGQSIELEILRGINTLTVTAIAGTRPTNTQ
jgi:serine protease DegS